MLPTFVFAQTFAIEQVPASEDLEDATSVGRGLSMLVRNDGSPSFSTYNTEGKLVFIEKLDDAWVFTSLTDDIVDGLIDDAYETSMELYENEPLIVYYDGVAQDLKVAVRSAGVWSHSTIDAGADSGENTGRRAAVRLITDGSVRICYEDVAADKLMIAEGNPAEGFEIRVLDADGGTWCSFVNDDKILYSKDENIILASLVDDAWVLEDTLVDGVQPIGGIDADGDFEFYAAQVKNHYGNNGESDLQLQGYYEANGGSPNRYNSDVGMYPVFVADVGRAARRLSYSALFGNSAAVYALIKKPDGMYQYAINPFGACLKEIRHVQLAKTNGLVHVAFSTFCSTESTQVIHYATLEVAPDPEEEEEDEEEEDEESEDDSDDDDSSPEDDDSDSDDSEDSPESDPDNSDSSPEPEEPDNDDGDNDDDSDEDSDPQTIDDIQDGLENWDTLENPSRFIQETIDTITALVTENKRQKKMQRQAKKKSKRVLNLLKKTPTSKKKIKKQQKAVKKARKKLAKTMRKLQKVFGS